MALASSSTSALPSPSPYDLSAPVYEQQLRQGNASGGMRGVESSSGVYTSSSRVISSSSSAREASNQEDPVFLQTKTRSLSTPAKAHGSPPDSSSSNPLFPPPAAPFARPNRVPSPSPSTSSTGRRAPPEQQHQFQQQSHSQFVLPQQYSNNGSLGFPVHNDGHPFPHSQYPFIPSPHGNLYQGAPGPFSPGFSMAGSEAQYQHQAMLLQQAQYQQQQWQMEMMRNQQMAAANYAAQYGSQQQGTFYVPHECQPHSQSRRRATSGPAPNASSQKQSFHNSPPMPFPTSPLLVPIYSTPGNSQSPYYSRGSSSGPIPPPQAGGHPYPTPPGSTDGRDGQALHGYRRGSQNEAIPRSQSPSRKATNSPSPVSQPSSSSMSSIPSTSSSSKSTSTAATSQHKRSDSSVSLSMQNFPPLPKSTLPLPTSSAVPSPKRVPVRSLPNTTSPAPNQTLSSPVAPPRRIRTQSSNSSDSSRSSRPDPSVSTEDNSSTSSPATSISSTTAPTAVVAGKRPSPLSQQVERVRPATPSSDRERERPGTPGTVRAKSPSGFRNGDDGEDSDDTASGTVVTASTLGKEKFGMKTKFKKAFSISASTSGTTSPNLGLSDKDMDGKGPKLGLNRLRSNSMSSAGSSPPLTPVVDAPSSSTSLDTPSTSSKPTDSTSKPPPAQSSSRRFGILNSKMNGSTDNLSISSTVSSASVMIRKLGQLGNKLGRRASLMSLTKAFKSKDKDEDRSKPGKADAGTEKSKGQPAVANVSHVTAEVEGSTRVAGMSPAAALAKKHQQQYAAQEAAAAAAAALVPPRSFAVHARSDSNASDTGSTQSLRSGWGATKSQEDVIELAGSAKSRLMLEKEKEKLKSRKVRKWGLGFGSRSETDLKAIISASPTTQPSSTPALDSTPNRDDEATRQDQEVLESPRVLGTPGSAFDDSSIEFEIQSIAPGDDDYEPSLRGVMPLGPRKDARAVKGILKGAGTYNQEDFAPLRSPAVPRTRADSSTSSPSPSHPLRTGSPVTITQLSSIPSEAQVDGLIRGESDHSPAHGRSLSHSNSSHPSPYGYPSMNVSAPTLNSSSLKAPTAIRAASSGAAIRRIVFAQNLSVHTTWPATVYDRRAEPATCNRLTPTLAQRIKEELNAYKMEEMDVHPTSRQLTHFFSRPQQREERLETVGKLGQVEDEGVLTFPFTTTQNCPLLIPRSIRQRFETSSNTSVGQNYAERIRSSQNSHDNNTPETRGRRRRLGPGMNAPSDAPPLLSLVIPDATNPPARADLLGIKLRLAALLPPQSGQLYWTALVDFVTGKINRQELGHVIKSVFRENSEALQLHNALILSILYNTTRSALPPSSIRHSGWHKRKRDKDGQSVSDRDPKRRRIKEQIMAIGKRERAEIKSLASAKKAAELEKQRVSHDAKLHALSASLDSKDAKLGPAGLPLALAEAKGTQDTLVQEYMRCLQTPLCSESKLLPDAATLKDRMSLVAYDSGLVGGTDSRVAALGVQALEMHLKTMISGVISLIRSNRANGIRTTSRAQLLASSSLANASSSNSPPLQTTFSPALGRASPVKIIVFSDGSEGMVLDSVDEPTEETTTRDVEMDDEDDNTNTDQHEAPLSASDFASLFEISPHLLVLPHVGAIERLYALPSPGESEDSDCSSSDDDEERETPDQVAAGGFASALGGDALASGSVQPITRSRSGTRSGRLIPGKSNTGAQAGEGRKQYVIDPSAIVIPVGHPDVVHSPSSFSTSFTTLQSQPNSNSASPLLSNPFLPPTTTSSSSTPNSELGQNSRTDPAGSRRPTSMLSGLRNGVENGATSTKTGTSTSALSPKSLALSRQLFPELDPGNSSPRIKMEGPSSTNQAQASEPGNDTSTDGGSESDEPNQQPRGRGRIPNAAKNRKLFDVVDSRRLLDGVLD